MHLLRRIRNEIRVRVFAELIWRKARYIPDWLVPGLEDEYL